MEKTAELLFLREYAKCGIHHNYPDGEKLERKLSELDGAVSAIIALQAENDQLKQENERLRSKADKWDKLAAKMAEFYKENSGADLVSIGEAAASSIGYL